ncbi:hypothetical protein DFH09DRAFT_1482286 [Mycena vulgaris]|nr:hypothetical protein DFH09DRAFT_1482286 [Mycena vulgaris]
MVNIAKIKATHNTMRTCILVTEAALHPYTAAPSASSNESASESAASVFNSFESASESSASDALPIATSTPPARAELWAVRNVRPGFVTRLGLAGGVLYAGVDTVLRGRVLWTLGHHGKRTNASTTSPDALATRPAAACAPIAYPSFEPPLSTDLMNSDALRGTNHAEGEAVHLRAKAEEEEETRGVDAQEMPPPPRSHVAVNVCASSVTVPAPTLIVNPSSLDYDLSPPLDLIAEVRAKDFAPLPPPALPLNSMTPRRPANMSCIGIAAPRFEPVENCWAHLKQEIRKHPRFAAAKTPDNLFVIAKDVWHSPEFKEYAIKVYKSFPRRLEALRDAKGMWIDY